jgi:hypothetical protein
LDLFSAAEVTDRRVRVAVEHDVLVARARARHTGGQRIDFDQPPILNRVELGGRRDGSGDVAAHS